MWMASVSQERGMSVTDHAVLCSMHTHLTVRVYNVSIELTPRAKQSKANRGGKKETVVAGDLLLGEKQEKKSEWSLPSQWYYLSMWQLLQCGMKELQHACS